MVYRPPKKKLSGPGSPAGASGSSNRPSSTADNSGTPLKGDDRNLVSVDENFAQADFEDRSWLFWHRNRNKIVGFALVLCVGVLVWQCWRLYQGHELENLQTLYQTADGPAALQSFAQANPGADLGKIAQIEAADAFYKNKQFKEAAAAYAQAVTLFGKEPNAQRARVGQAISILQGGDSSAGKQQLDAIFADTTMPDNLRGEAGFDLAMLAYQAGDGAATGKYLDGVKALPQAGIWVEQARGLAAIIPVISDVQLPAAPTTNTSLAPAGMDLRRGLPSGQLGTAPAAPAAPGSLTVEPSSAPPASTTPPPASPAATTSPAPTTPTPATVAPVTSPAAPAASTAKPASTSSIDLPALVH